MRYPTVHPTEEQLRAVVDLALATYDKEPTYENLKAVRRARSKLDYLRNHNKRVASHEAYNAEHQIENAAYRREWQVVNKDKVALQGQLYRTVNAEKCREQARTWYYSHLEEARLSSSNWYRNNLEHARALNAIWAKSHPEDCQRYNANRRAKLAGASGSFTNDEFRALCREFDGSCAYCGLQETETERLVPDHMLPLAKGGDNSIWNIIPACKRCNASKRDKTLEEYLDYLQAIDDRSQLGGAN
jgi:5-methylcytosine-specific restriction endonuclease McrA